MKQIADTPKTEIELGFKAKVGIDAGITTLLRSRLFSPAGRG